MLNTQEGKSCNIRGCSQELLSQFEALQKRLHTRTHADTLLALCRIAQAKVDGKLRPVPVTGK